MFGPDSQTQNLRFDFCPQAKEKVEEEYNAIQKRVLATLTRYDSTMRDAESGADVLTQVHCTF
jgi:hypothetical protein